MKDTDKLKQMAAPSSERIALATEVLAKEQVETNRLLGVICDYKQEQKDGDKKYRKKSTLASMLSICIALTALYISVVGLDGKLAGDVMMWFNSIGVLL